MFLCNVRDVENHAEDNATALISAHIWLPSYFSWSNFIKELIFVSRELALATWKERNLRQLFEGIALVVCKPS